MSGKAPQAPDSFDSPDGRTYSGPVSGEAPGQADAVPDVFARYQLATFPTDLADFAANETAMRWKHLTGEAERKFWRELGAAQERPARGLSDLASELERLACEHRQKADEYDRDAAQENFHRGCAAALNNAAGRIRHLIASPDAPAGERPATDAMHRVRELTSGILGVAEALEASAAKTAPSKKSDIENETAGKLRGLLDVQ